MPHSRDIIEIYKNLYNLPELTYKEKVDFDFFRLCDENYKFIVISVYNEKREFLLARDFNKNIGWELIGGYIKKDEKIEDAINRIVLKETGLTIDELQPIALINNNFEWNNRIILHRGIAFAALARGKTRPQPENIKIIYTKDVPEKMAYQNREILKRTKQILENKVFEPPYKEIEGAKKFFLFYFINKYLIKIIGNFSSKRIQNQILKLISNNPKSIIDVTCGDDNFIFKLEKLYNPEICIANDISWQITSLTRNKHKNSNIIFTNHNVLDLVFTKKFDLIIFKNTLHHIPLSEQINLIKRLSNLSKQLIIVDIEDPSKSNFLSKIWHWYYVCFLGDQGGSFLTIQKFKEIIEKNIKNKKSDFSVVNTIKGKYFFTSLSEITQGEEVEIKAKIELSQIKSIRRNLIALGAVFKEKIKESDSYFTAPHRDFIKTKECLRIRERDDYLELTYKGPTTKSMDNKKQFWKSEINIPLHSSRKEAEMLLESLNFTKVVEVNKKREKFVLGRQEISLDDVENLGWFLEIENTITNGKEIQKALNENIALFKKLGLDEKNIITETYRDLVSKKTRFDFSEES
jgi:adenylate cyclase, class 2